MYTVILVHRGGDLSWLSQFDGKGYERSIEGEQVVFIEVPEAESGFLDSQIPIEGWEVRLRGDITGITFEPWTEFVLSMARQMQNP